MFNRPGRQVLRDSLFMVSNYMQYVPRTVLHLLPRRFAQKRASFARCAVLLLAGLLSSNARTIQRPFRKFRNRQEPIVISVLTLKCDTYHRAVTRIRIVEGSPPTSFQSRPLRPPVPQNCPKAARNVSPGSSGSDLPGHPVARRRMLPSECSFDARTSLTTLINSNRQ